MILAHLSSSDLVQGFYGVNRRFDEIVCELISHFTISNEITKISFDQYQPQIKTIVEKICFDVQLWPQICLPTYAYSNLRSIVLSCSNFATVDLNVNCQSTNSMVHSCLEVLRICNVLPNDWRNAQYHSKSAVDFRVGISGHLPAYVT